MLNHHIQKSIIYRLALTSPLRFSDLKPAELDNKLFNYHLKIVMRLGLVAKDSNGLYVLTSEGKTLGVHVYSEVANTFNRARSVLLLAVHNKNKWLMYKRLNEPLKNLVGFMHCEPEAGVSLTAKASDYLLETCHIKADFGVAGSGISTTLIGDEVESYINFTVLSSSNPTGTLSANDPLADYFWVDNKVLNTTGLLPNTTDILVALETKRFFFIDKTYTL